MCGDQGGAVMSPGYSTVLRGGVRPLDLTPWFNNVGITPAGRTSGGALNVWGNSLPAEELPAGDACEVGGVPFRLPRYDGVTADNVRCAGQFVPLPPTRHDWLHLLACAERRVEDDVAIHFRDGAVDFEPLRLSDFWAADPVFGENAVVSSTVMHYPHHVQPGVTGRIWHQRVPVTRRADAIGLRFPQNAAVHIFAATLVGPGAEGPDDVRAG